MSSTSVKYESNKRKTQGIMRKTSRTCCIFKSLFKVREPFKVAMFEGILTSDKLLTVSGATGGVVQWFVNLLSNQ